MAEYIPNQSSSLRNAMRDEYGRLLSGVSGIVTSSIAEPVAGLNALVYGNPELVQRTRNKLTVGNPANLIPNNLSLPEWTKTGIGYFNESADRLGTVSPVAGAALKTAPAFINALIAPQSRSAFFNVTDDIGRAMANPSFKTMANAQRGAIGNLSPKPKPKPKKLSTDDIIRIQDNSPDEKLFIRWSRGKMYDNKPSRDYISGSSHGGLSAVEIENWTKEYMPERLKEYRFLRMKDEKIKPQIMRGKIVGIDSDGYPSIDINSAEYVGIWDEAELKQAAIKNGGE